MDNNSIRKTFTVALLLCLACSVVVSTSAVVLQPAQKINRELELQRSVLQAVGLAQVGEAISSAEVQKRFANFEALLVELETGESMAEVGGFNATSYDTAKALRSAELSRSLDSSEDIAGLKRQELYSRVYLLRAADGSIDKIVIPIRGYGLWSTLWGFLALEPDGKQIAGITFYQHAETPGLGGEVDNPKWKQQFIGKLAYDESWQPALQLTKGGSGGVSQVDALSGASLTSRGVNNLLYYWLSEAGFQKFLQEVARGNV